MKLPDLTARIRIDTSELKGVEKQTAGMLGGIGKAAVVAGAAAAAGLAAFGAVGVKGAADVEGGLREVVTLLGETGAAAQESLRGFQAETAALSNELGVAQTELTSGLYSAISAGVPKENAFTFLQIAAKAGIAGVADTETAVDGLTTTLNAFGLNADQTQAVADSMFAAVKGGKTTFGELSASMSNVAPAAAAAGVSFQEVNAGIATLTAAGVPTAQATTQLRAALVGLQKPSKDMDKIFQALGYSNAQTAIEAEGLGFALGAVKDAAGGDQGKLTTLLGSVEAVGAANVLAGTGAAKFAAEMDRQATAAGSVDDAFAVMSEGVGYQMDLVKTRLHNAAIAFGTILLPAISGVLTVVAGFATALATNLVPALQAAGAKVQEMAAFVQENSTVFTVVGGIIASVLIPALVLLGIHATAVAVKVVAAWVAKQAAAVKAGVVHGASIVKMVAKWVWHGVQATAHAARVVAAWLATQAGAIAAGVVIAAQTAIMVAKWLWLGVQSALHAAKVVASWVITSAGAVAAGVVMAAQAALMVAKWALMGTQALAHAARIAAAWLIAMGPIGLVIAAVIGVVALIIANFDTIKSTIAGAWEWVKTRTQAAWIAAREAVSNGIAAVMELVRSLPGKITSALGNLGSLLVKAGGDLLRGLGSGITGAVKGVVDKAVRAAKAVVDGVKGFLGISSPSRVMAEQVGRPMAEGIAVGIAKSQGLVDEALAGATAVPDVRAVAGVGVGVGNAAAARLDGALDASGGTDRLVEAMVSEIRLLRDEVRTQTERHLLFSRTMEVAVGG